jgi:hypothetical protein
MASIISAGTTSGTSLNLSGDTSGVLQLASNGSTTAVTIDTNQRVAFVAGTAALPAITTTGDTNTGIFFSAADTIDFAEGGTACGQFDSSANFKFNSGYGSVATAYGCRAWVNFNGTGTVAIRASGNVTSITDNGTGDYTVNFPAMPDANYTAVANSDSTNSSSPQGMAINFSPVINNNVAPTSIALRVACWVLSSGAGFDNSYINVAIFR